jgi:plasmid maintenance system killer protein
LKSLTRPSFWRAYGELDPRVREAARKAYAQFAKAPGRPSLRFKKLAGYEQVWSVRINEQYGAVGECDGDTAVWV